MQQDTRNGDRQPQTALEPVVQEDIPFHDHTITAVRLEDGRIAVVLRWVCEVLNMNPQAQVQRIERTAAITGELVRVKVQPRQAGTKGGGRQTMPALTLRGFPVWILGINANEVADGDDPPRAEHIRQMIRAYQLEAVDVLYQHFAQKVQRPALSEPGAEARATLVREAPTVIEAEPFKPQQEPGPDATDAERATYHAALSLWHRWKADRYEQKWRGQVIAWQGDVESRIESMEEVVRSVLPKLGLSPEHQASVRAAIEQLWKLTGTPRQALYYELNQAFQVAKYADIADEEWRDVTTWLSTRINAAKGR